MEQHSNQNKSRRLLYLFLAGVVLAAGLLGGVNAHYRNQQSGRNNQATAGDFYFTLDLLAEGETTRTLALYGGEEQTVTFAVENFQDELRISQTDIPYTVTVTSEEGKTVNYTLTKNEENATGGTLTGKTSSADAYQLTLSNGYADGTQVTVTVASTAPYQKTLTLELVLYTGDPEVQWRVEDAAASTGSSGQVAATLIIMSSVELEPGKLVIDWSAINQGSNVLQIDTTNPYVLSDSLTLTDTGNDPGATFLSQVTNSQTIHPGESIAIYFFKTDLTKSYAVSNTAAQKTEDNQWLIQLGN